MTAADLFHIAADQFAHLGEVVFRLACLPAMLAALWLYVSDEIKCITTGPRLLARAAIIGLYVSGAFLILSWFESGLGWIIAS